MLIGKTACGCPSDGDHITGQCAYSGLTRYARICQSIIDFIAYRQTRHDQARWRDVRNDVGLSHHIIDRIHPGQRVGRGDRLCLSNVFGCKAACLIQ